MADPAPLSTALDVQAPFARAFDFTGNPLSPGIGYLPPNTTDSGSEGPGMTNPVVLNRADWLTASKAARAVQNLYDGTGSAQEYLAIERWARTRSAIANAPEIVNPHDPGYYNQGRPPTLDEVRRYQNIAPRPRGLTNKRFFPNNAYLNPDWANTGTPTALDAPGASTY